MREVIVSLSFMISYKGNNPENISNLSKTTQIEIELKRVLTQPVPPYGKKGDDAGRGVGWGMDRGVRG